MALLAGVPHPVTNRAKVRHESTKMIQFCVQNEDSDRIFYVGHCQAFGGVSTSSKLERIQFCGTRIGLSLHKTGLFTMVNTCACVASW